jgi:GNAT superfamily N-acetyltransferase
VEALERERVVAAESVDDATVIGYVTCALWGSTVTVGRLAVAPDRRRKGIGGALMSDVAQWAQKAGAFTIGLCTQEDNAESRALYSACGLTELPEHYVLAASRA